MESNGWSPRRLLVLLVIGVWTLCVIVVVTGFWSRAEGRREYGVWAADEGGNLAVNKDGSLPLTATGLMKALQETPRQGWRLHSIVFSANLGGYTVIVER